MKRSIVRVTAAAAAVLAPISLAMAAPASAGTPVTELTTPNFVSPGEIVASDDEVFNDPKYADIASQAWVQKIKRFRSLSANLENGEKKPAFDNVHVYMVSSPSMDGREVPVAVIQPRDPAARENAPTQYLLNGADGGEGSANWIMQTDVVEFYGGNPWADLNEHMGKKGVPATVGNGVGANIVIPMAGAFSYYTDWVNEEPGHGGKQNWETFVTSELPQAVEPALNANGKRGIAGLSMSGTSTLNFAEHHPGRYDTVGSFSGCAATTSGLAPQFIDITLNRGGTSMQTMWGGVNSPAARDNDPLLNAEKLRGQENLYVSNGSGWAGPYDLPSARRVDGNIAASAKVIIEGGAIETATNACTHELRAKTDSLGIPVTYNFRPQGTHQWGYWEEDMRAYWPIMQKGLGTDPEKFAKPAQDPYLEGAAGGMGSSLPGVGSLEF